MDLTHLTIHDLIDLLRKKEINSQDIVKSYLKRISETESDLNSFISVFEDYAIKRAKQVDDTIIRMKTISDLAGIPCSIKDNIMVEGFKTTCASKMMKDFIAPYDATVSKKLKEDGAIIIGKNNMDEFAMGSSNETSYFNSTKNPVDKSRVPGGSSGGSAASVASRQVLFSIASSTGGSVRQPASYCGVVGLKPTYGLISRYGLVSFASSLDQIGIITKNVEDCAIVLNSVSGNDKFDSTSINREKENYREYLIDNIKGMKIGIPREYFGSEVDERIREKVLEEIMFLERLGANIDEISLPTTEYALSAYYIISLVEASSNLGRFDGIRYGYRSDNYSSIEDLIIKNRSEGFGEEVKKRILIGNYFLSSSNYEKYYEKACKIRTLLKNEYENIFRKYDVLITPTTINLPFKLGSKESNGEYGHILDKLTTPANLVGIPAMTIPCGKIDNLPIGMQIMSNRLNEKAIFKIAYAYEKNKVC
ncbi:glutamyl-tRNA(Gln) amidotransferase subunit A [Gottschalkia purinilytica]|uniref:Glutamyl-tRNA(Gln) amidotransferase subunit A n=1 Tax=Gottschalkia purinilytica TaxID=1503 RepID=A0A0L0W6T6_GOTPU|nr:Asp-tRNA(Asn)/Glu-tRNA(Gln) amidotransferase subunit GatA [Gottschalkia purinilytica]KNF07244.1 glutamyl-tRNA(Gln) amidotransferase subunit A [Gottschalkia purinilytica]